MGVWDPSREFESLRRELDRALGVAHGGAGRQEFARAVGAPNRGDQAHHELRRSAVQLDALVSQAAAVRQPELYVGVQPVPDPFGLIGQCVALLGDTRPEWQPQVLGRAEVRLDHLGRSEEIVGRLLLPGAVPSRGKADVDRVPADVGGRVEFARHAMLRLRCSAGGEKEGERNRWKEALHTQQSIDRDACASVGNVTVVLRPS